MSSRSKRDHPSSANPYLVVCFFMLPLALPFLGCLVHTHHWDPFNSTLTNVPITLLCFASAACGLRLIWRAQLPPRFPSYLLGLACSALSLAVLVLALYYVPAWVRAAGAWAYCILLVEIVNVPVYAVLGRVLTIKHPSGPRKWIPVAITGIVVVIAVFFSLVGIVGLLI